MLRIVNAASMAVINVQKIHNKYADVSAGIIEDINYVLKKNNGGEDGLVGDVTGFLTTCLDSLEEVQAMLYVR